MSCQWQGPISAVTLTVVLAACSGGGGAAQDELADLVINLYDDLSIELDNDCVRNVTTTLSDNEAQALADPSFSGAPVASDKEDVFFDEIETCVYAGTYVDVIVGAAAARDDSVGEDCMLERLRGLTYAELDDQFVDATVACSGE